MSKALRCDRCLVCFDPYNISGEFITIKNCLWQNKTAFKNGETIYREDGLNLCPACTKEFSKWMLGNRAAPDVDSVVKSDIEASKAHFDASTINASKDLLEKLRKIANSMQFGQDRNKDTP